MKIKLLNVMKRDATYWTASEETVEYLKLALAMTDVECGGIFRYPRRIRVSTLCVNADDKNLPLEFDISEMPESAKERFINKYIHKNPNFWWFGRFNGISAVDGMKMLSPTIDVDRRVDE